MKRLFFLIICFGATSMLISADVVARGPGGGGRGGGGRSGGGMSRGGGGMSHSGGMSRGGGGMSHSSRSPSMSRPSSGMSRPSGGGMSRPSGGDQPSFGGSRPSVGGQPGTGTRPSTGSRPNTGTRPGGGTTPGAGSQPSTGTRPGGTNRPGGDGGRPTQGQLNDFLDLPKAGTGTPGSGNRPSGGGSDFIQNRPPQAGQRPSERPGFGDRPSERPRAGQGPAADNRPDRIDNRQDNQQGRQDNRTDRQDNRTDRQDSVSDRRDNRIDDRDNLRDNRVDRVDNRQDLRSNRVERRDEVRDQVRRNPPRNDFWRANRYASRWTRPYRWATWGAVSTWFPWGWTQPVAYNYGDNVYVQEDTVYYGEQAMGSPREYGQQAFAFATSADEVAPDASAHDTEWLSLGVFAMTQDDQASGPAPNLFIQLAVSKEGMIAGTYYNNSTEKPQEIEGVVDKKTQRTAWTVGASDWPVMETGISNLTQDEAPALIHFANGQTQKWLLVRLEDPEGTAQQ